MLTDGLWKITTIIFAIVILIVFPILRVYEFRDRIIEINLESESDLFLNKIRKSGKIKKQSLENFQNKINNLGINFDIEIEHYKQVFIPVYLDENDKNSFTGEIKILEELNPNSHILDVLYKEMKDSYNMNKGDYVHIRVIAKNQSNTSSLRKIFTGFAAKTRFFYRLSGEVIYEGR